MDRLVVSLIWPMQKRTKLSHIEVKALEKQVLFSINNNLSFLKIHLLGRILFQLIKQLMQCHGPKHLSCQNYTTIGGRLVSFLWPFSSHHWRFFLLVMDEFIRFYVARLHTKGNMKLQLGTS